MVRIQTKDRELIVRLLGPNKLLAFRSSVTIPFAHVVDLRPRPPEARFDEHAVETYRGVGTYVPGKLAAGTLFTEDGLAFYAVRDPSKAIAIDVTGEPFKRLVVEVDDETPEACVRRLVRALHWHSPEGEPLAA